MILYMEKTRNLLKELRNDLKDVIIGEIRSADAGPKEMKNESYLKRGTKK